MIWRFLLSGIWKPVVGLLALAAMWFGGRRSAKSDAKAKAAEAKAEAWEVRNEVENRVAVERDTLDRLRRDWKR